MTRFLFAMPVSLLCLNLALAAEPLKSGPQVGTELPCTFHPLNVNGENAGHKTCIFCQFGDSPVAMVFARQVTPEVTKLIKQLDQATTKNKAAEMESCVIFCSDDNALKGKLEELAKKDGLKDLILGIEKSAGPAEYNIGKDADVTVILYFEKMVKVNHSFRKGELDEKAIDKIVGDLPKVLPKK